MKNKKGAALIITLFMLVIVSTFVSLIFLISKNEIKLYGKAREESKYTQYLKEAVDITISPLVMGRGDWVWNDSRYRSREIREDEFCEYFNNRLSDSNILTNNSGISLSIVREILNNPEERKKSFIINISRRIEPNSNVWVVSNVRGEASYIQRLPVLPVPEYELNINTIIVSNPNNINRGVDNFASFVNTVRNSIIWTGRARATVQQRTPYNVAGGSALFVKYAGLWVPFGANPFYTALTTQGIDSCVGLTDGYSILGDVATPNAVQQERFINSFDRMIDTNKSGITTVWDGTNGKIIRGGATTGYAEIAENLTTFNSANQDFSIRTNYNARVNNGEVNSNVNGRIPGEALAGNNVVDLDSISPTRTTIRIAPPNNQAVVVGERVDGNGNLTGQIRTRQQGGGLVEVLWPLDQNGNPVPINPNNGNDPNRRILNSYPPGYANVYVVPEGNRLRIFAVGKYSGRKVPANELRGAISFSQGININMQQENGTDLVIDLNGLTPQQRTALSTVHVEGGNVILMPSSSGDSTLWYGENQNQRQPFDLTVIATRFRNTDDFGNRDFYVNPGNAQQGIDTRIGGWNINTNQPITPNNFTVNLGGNGISYVIPNQDPGTYDRRRQVLRALEGNVIIQDFHDNIGNGGVGRKENNERFGYVGGKIENNSVKREGGNFNILAHNFVILNYQSKKSNRNNIERAYLFADIVSYRGSLQIIDEDSYRFLLDTGRFRRQESENFLNLIVRDDDLYWYGRYIGNFANIEGVLLQNGTIRGFSTTTIESSGRNDALPRATRSDYRVRMNGRDVILYSVLRFEINR
ncbi:MAG: hypothetical protein ACK4GJ_04220 [bacterium]